MAINLSPKRPAIDTGVNIMTGTKKSPSLLTLNSRSVGDVAPNEDQVLADVASTVVAPTVQPQVTPVQPPEVEPEVSPVTDVPEVATVATEEKVEPPVPPKDPLGSLVEVPVEQEDPEVVPLDEDPFADSIPMSMLSDTYAIDDETAAGDFLPSDVTGSAYKSEEEMDFIETAKHYYDNANKLSYGLAKAAAGTLDLITVPGWALAHVAADGAKFPFTGFLEEFYPEKQYQFEEDPDSYADEVLRFTQTGLEFVGGGAVLNTGAKVVTKGAYAVSQKAEAAVSAVAALGYQGALEMGASEGVALLTSFLAPMSPELVKASYKVSTAAAKATVSVPLAILDKTTDALPLVGLLKQEVKDSSRTALQVQKQKLLADDKLWSDTFLKRQARKIVLETKDTVKTTEQQAEEIANIQRWINAAFPDTPEVREHVSRMKTLQDNINAELPEGSKIEFTLEQIYAPVLRNMNADSGLKEVVESIRITQGDAYNAKLLKNREAMVEYVAKKRGEMGPEETQAFKDIFEAENESILKLQETIYGLSRNLDMIDPASSNGYRFSDEPVSKELRPALENIRGLLDQSYEAAMQRLPKDAEVDTTAVADAITDIYDELGVFARPESIPAYLKTLVQGLQTNATGGVASAYKVQRANVLNSAEELRTQNSLLLQKMNEMSIGHKKAVAALGDDKKAVKALKLQQAEEMNVLRQQHVELMTARKDLSVAKRTQKVNEATTVTGVEGLPQPNLVTVDDITKGLRAINFEIRKAMGSKDRDKLDTLFKLKGALDESLEGLVAVDPDAYALFKAANSHYKQFVSTDFNESFAADITEIGDHLHKIVSEDAVARIWDNAGNEGMMRFLRNFDGTRDGLGNYLRYIDEIKVDPEGTPAIDLYSKEAERGVTALRDVIYTSLAQKVRVIDADVTLDPVVRMGKVKNAILDFRAKHEAKLVQIPGFETFGENVDAAVADIASYTKALEVLDDRRNMSILRDVVGPGHTIGNIMRDDRVAQDMDDFLNNRLTKVAVDGVEDTRIQEATASQIRKTLSRAFVNEHTRNGNIDYETLDRVLAPGSKERNNLSLVLGESEVLKLDVYRHLGRAMAEGDVTFTEVLVQNQALRNLTALGLPLGRIGSMLQRRAVFTPSGAYVAGAVASKMLDAMGSKQTSRAMQLLMERPFDVLHLDQVLLNEMKNLPQVKRKLLDDVMQGSTRHYRELKSWLPKTLAPAMRAHSAYLGYKFSLEEAEKMVSDSLNEDPRHPEFNVVEPVVPEVNVEIKREVPELLQRPEDQMDVSQESMDAASANDPMHEVTNATGEGIITDGMTSDEATMAKAVDQFITIRGHGTSKEDAKRVLMATLPDNNNRVLLLKALDKAYAE